MIGACVSFVGILAWKLCWVSSPAANPALAKQWHEQVYSLDEDETIRFVPPPYSPQRMKDFARGWGGSPPNGVSGQLCYHVLPTRTFRWGMGSGGNVSSGLAWCTELTRADLDMSDNLGLVPVYGDWITRIDAPVDRRMQALESTLRTITGRQLLFEKKMIERDVIVARGRWSFHQDKEYSGIGKSQIGAVHLYTLPLSPVLGSGAGTGELSEFLKTIEQSSLRKLVDEIQPPRPKSVQWTNDQSQYAAADDETKLDNLLANVQKQTSIQFSKEKRMISVWFIRDRSRTEQPVSK